LKFIRNNLNSRGLETGPLQYNQLHAFDQHHYHGVEILDLCASECSINDKSVVVNLGSGFGGPARYFGGKLGASVIAVEIQEDVDRLAKELTQRCGLTPLVSHVCGDVLTYTAEMAPGSCNAFVSWLTLLHIHDRPRLIKQCTDALKVGGVFFVEDFYEAGHFTADELKVLAEDVAAVNVFDLLTYKRALSNAGLVIEKVEDLSADWTKYTKDRVAYWTENKESLVKLHRSDTYNHLLEFYSKVQKLFEGGRLGGVRFVARKPPQLTLSQ
jgi:SAM-dependent methyltransferase